MAFHEDEHMKLIGLVLIALKNGEDVSSLYGEYEKEDVLNALMYCSENGYVSGISADKNIDGNYIGQHTGKIAITQEGLRLLGC